MRQNRWVFIRISFDANRFDELAAWSKLRSMKVTGQIQGDLSPELKNNHHTVTISLPESMVQDIMTEAERTDGMTATIAKRKNQSTRKNTSKRKKKKR